MSAITLESSRELGRHDRGRVSATRKAVIGVVLAAGLGAGTWAWTTSSVTHVPGHATARQGPGPVTSQGFGAYGPMSASGR